MIADLFADALKRAAERQLPFSELFTIAGRLQAGRELRLAEALYRTWLQFNADDAFVHAVQFNFGVLLGLLQNYAGARAAFEEAIRIAPDFYPPYINLGGTLDRMGAPGDAINTWTALVNRLPWITGENLNFKLSALKQIGRVLERSNMDAQAEDALRFSLDIDPRQNDVAQHFISLRQRQCKWPVVAAWNHCNRKSLLSGISALSLGAYTDDPLFQLGNAYHYCRHVVGPAEKTFLDTHARLLAAPPSRQRIGYLSSDLREHAIGYLTSEVYELHDREKVEVFAYYCGIPSPDPIQERIKAAVEHWVDISAMSDEQAGQRIVDDGIEILVDVNGYTNGQRSKMLAMRPAPILVNWLGFPGTMGSPYHNYVIADEFIIPPESELFYSEKVMRVPCYQANDRKRVMSDKVWTRADAKLPADALVLCCFNGLHKISVFTWVRWMMIMAQLPDSVLWLLDGPQSTMDRLRKFAGKNGIAPDRIVFAPKLRNAEHLARYTLADLFLDTAPYGAHTTSSDALWTGVPVLTYAGRSFASRVCGSLVRAAGMAEMICASPEEFVQRAIELGRDRPRLAALRAKLKANRDTCVLFDMPLLVRSLEQRYEEMWQDFRTGRLPRPDLTNLEVYNEIGMELDRDDVEMQAVDDYLDRYRRALAAKAESIYLGPDPRLWDGTKPR
jgi:predicted O-linked N-acetylglucosamine transferase (SPINDLY family)